MRDRRSAVWTRSATCRGQRPPSSRLRAEPRPRRGCAEAGPTPTRRAEAEAAAPDAEVPEAEPAPDAVDAEPVPDPEPAPDAEPDPAAEAEPAAEATEEPAAPPAENEESQDK